MDCNRRLLIQLPSFAPTKKNVLKEEELCRVQVPWRGIQSTLRQPSQPWKRWIAKLACFEVFFFSFGESSWSLFFRLRLFLPPVVNVFIKSRQTFTGCFCPNLRTHMITDSYLLLNWIGFTHESQRKTTKHVLKHSILLPAKFANAHSFPIVNSNLSSWKWSCGIVVTTDIRTPLTIVEEGQSISFLAIQVVVAIRSPSLTYFFFSYFKSASFFRYGPTVRYVDFLQNFCRGIARFGTF